MSSSSRSAALRRESIASEQIPYSALVSDRIVRTTLLDYLMVFRLNGSSFESADDEQLNNWHERLNMLWRNIAAPGIALWTHVIRRRETVATRVRSAVGFADALHHRYHERLGGEALMVNEIYLAIVYRPLTGRGSGIITKALMSSRRGDSQREHLEAIESCEKLSQTCVAALARYEPQPLGSYRIGSTTYSSLLEFLALLINGESRRVPLPRGPLTEALPEARVLFGSEAIEYRLAASTHVGAMLGIKEYPTPTVVGFYDRLLAAPFPFVLTQSFTFLSKTAAQGLLQRQMHRLANAGDYGVSQAAQLEAALDALTGNEFVMGEHHFSLQVLAELAAAQPAGERLKPLNDHIALARSLLAESGMTVAREDLALEAAFWAQLPGNFPLRPRRAPITSRNLAAMASFHNYPTGRASGNHWGEALATLMTSARSPYHFSLHASDPSELDGGSRKDTGHTFICGPTGSGKTVFIGFLVTMLSRCDTTQILFDKDHGLEILVRALGGEYLALRNGVPTGLNPLQLPATPQQGEFLKRWLRCLVVTGGQTELSVRQQTDLDQALNGTLALERRFRRLSRLVEFLDPTDPEGMHARLAPWCQSTRGDYAWVFDNAEDSMVPQLSGRPTVGIDVTDFLDNPRTRAPVSLYLFHLIRQLLDGRRLVCWMDEFWRLLGDAAFEDFARDGPKTWRKLNGVMCLATQSAADVLGSRISRTIVEQTPTKVFFPNPEASLEEYVGGLGLTEREFLLIKQRLEPGSRRFLIKQGHHSVVCQLDLRGFEGELRVISGRAHELARMRALIEQGGSEPQQWLAAFMSRDSALSASA
jgi:type IV secretion system protein VirB4